MDFYQIKERTTRDGVIELFPDFKVMRSNDLMVRGKGFYSIWDAEKGLWSTDEYDVQRLIDNDLLEHRNKLAGKGERIIRVKFMSDFSTNAWKNFRTYMNNISDNAKQLDKHLTFQNTKVKKRDYVSRRLPYTLEKGKTDAYTKLMDTLFDADEQEKLEWALGAIVAGEAKDIQKFIVLYGEGGTGKSTFLNLVQKLFPGYYTTFEAKALVSTSNAFSTEVFRNNPLVALQHDGDLSNIKDNTKLNTLISHDEMTMNEKYKPSYMARANAFLFMATNKPVKITDAKSGIIRRLIDVQPSGDTVPVNQYYSLVSRMDFELGAIAQQCLDVYRKLGKNYYSTYRPLGMIFETDVFFNFVETHYYDFVQEGGVTLAQAWTMYKEFCEESLIDYKIPKYKFRDELKNYFENFEDRAWVDGKQRRNYYSELIQGKFKDKRQEFKTPPPGWLALEETTSLLDEVIAACPAQYASATYETPQKKWDKVKTKVSSLKTNKLHYVQLPLNHIVIDFDIRDDDGNKSPELNLEAATKWPPTYAEFSKSQQGIHLHYIYTGEDPARLSRVYDEGIEVKVFVGDSALRRKVSKCNSNPVAHISTGIPLKKKKMINFETVKSEKGLRDLITRNLKKEIHPGTKPSIDFIYKILQDAYESDTPYDVRDMRPAILAFAVNSTNQSQYAVKLVSTMQFASEEASSSVTTYEDERLAFFDVEVYPNLFLVNWKYQDTESEENECIHMINPTGQEIEDLMKLRLVGFNNRRYDNHILYARYIGYDNQQIYELSKKIIGGGRRDLFGEAYNISYADVYDFSSKKQSLKKFQIELGIHHQELPFPWDEPLAEEHWPQAIEYCDNDVKATEKVFNSRAQDFVARQILADLSGLSVNDSTLSQTSKIIFGNDPRPQNSFIYTDLSEMFPGYTFDAGKSLYRDEDPKEGGYVYAEPGFYRDVALLDIASMHPTSIELLDLFGPYTKNYSEIISARLAIKHKDYKKARGLLGGTLDKHLGSTDDADALAYALKIIINIVYGLTSAKFANKFKDLRNKDNIVAKRGSLFMIDLKHALKEEGITVAHIKTDSVKLPKATKKAINFVKNFGKEYGYTFEHEATYDTFCLVNDAVYVARDAEDGHWAATGAEFQHPYIFKTLFSHEPIDFWDMCEAKAVTTALYLDMNEELEEDEHNYQFVGKAGSFVPIKPGFGGGSLMREKEGKYYAATGTKGWRWLEAQAVQETGKEDDINLDYFRYLVDKAVAHLSEFCEFDELVN
jgi:hypothetical protein